MHYLTSFVTALAIAVSFISAVKVVPHRQVQKFEESIQNEKDGALHLHYKPFLEVVDGCVPFPAVQGDGGVSGGLKSSGAMNGKCDSSDGQVYSRSKEYNGMYAIMYSWYFPKDMNVDGPGNKGHRHDWENVVVWLSGRENPEIKGIAYSQHGGYDKATGKDAINWAGDRPKVQYYRIVAVIDHCLGRASTQGGQQPLIAWSSLTVAARDTLNTYDFGKANVPCSDANFFNNLEKAKI